MVRICSYPTSRQQMLGASPMGNRFSQDAALHRHLREIVTIFGITDQTLSGSAESLGAIVQILSRYEASPRVCVGFDATCLKPYVRMDKIGLLHGLPEINKALGSDQAKSVLGSDNPLQSLLDADSEEMS